MSKDKNEFSLDLDEIVTAKRTRTQDEVQEELFGAKKVSEVTDLKNDTYKVKNQMVYKIPVDIQRALDEKYPDISFSTFAKQAIREKMEREGKL
jgi:hypothetical protein